MGHEQVVQATGAGQADLNAGLKQRHRLLAQQAFGVVERDSLEKSLGRQAGPAGERFLELRRRLLQTRCDVLERGLLAPSAGNNVIRLLPPLNATAEELARSVQIFRETLAAKA